MTQATRISLSALILAACGGGPGTPALDAGDGPAPSDGATADGPAPSDGGLPDGVPTPDAVSVDAAPTACGTPAPIPSATAMLGPTGGVVTLPGPLRPTLTVPAGALAATTALTVTPTIVELPASRRALSAVYALLPEGVAFATPATLAIDAGALPDPDDVALFVSETAAGPYTQVVTARTGTVYTADVPGGVYAYAARVSAAPALTATTCAPVTLTPYVPPPPAEPPPPAGVMFSALPLSGDYYAIYPRATAGGFTFTGAFKLESLWTAVLAPYSASGVGAAPQSFRQLPRYLMTAESVPSAGGTTLVAYESNATGSEIWITRRDAAGQAVGTAVAISGTPVFDLRPRLVPTATGGAFVAWLVRETTANTTRIRAAAVAADLTVTRVFDVTTPQPGVGVGYPAVVSDGVTAGVVWPWNDNSGAAGVQFQSFDALTGCARTEIIPVAAGLVAAVQVSATAVGAQGLIAYSRTGSFDATRLRLIDLATGHLGASRLLGPGLHHTGVAVSATDGPVVIGIDDGTVPSSIRGYHLTRELDPRTTAFTLGTVRATADVVQAAASGDQGAAGWTSETPQTVEGRIAIFDCSP
ncbi:MAG: hypothetical protein JNK64_16245 [Myxococcales bacterium]|nr:hypothetical protein [Myxococcales bacterium]